MSTRVAITTWFERLHSEVDAFANWWLREVREASRSFQRRGDQQDAGCVEIILGETQGELVSTNPPVRHSFALSENGELPPLAAIWPDAPALRAVNVLLPCSATLSCELRLPKMPERRIDSAVRLQLERKLPVPSASVYIAWRVAERTSEIAGERVVVVAARRGFIDRIMSGLRRWNIPVEGVWASESAETTEKRLDLMPAMERKGARALDATEKRLGLVSLGLLALLTMIVGAQWWMERSSMADRIDQARAVLATHAEERELLERTARPLNALRAQMQNPSAAHALVALSEVLPEDAWIFNADLQAPALAPVRLEFAAYTSNASLLLQAIGKSPQFADLQLIEATGLDESGTKQRAEFRARFEGSAQ